MNLACFVLPLFSVATPPAPALEAAPSDTGISLALSQDWDFAEVHALRVTAGRLADGRVVGNTDRLVALTGIWREEPAEIAVSWSSFPVVDIHASVTLERACTVFGDPELEPYEISAQFIFDPTAAKARRVVFQDLVADSERMTVPGTRGGLLLVMNDIVGLSGGLTPPATQITVQPDFIEPPLADDDVILGGEQ